MRKLKLERVTGIVALSYLVLIPVGGVLIWQRVRIIDKDLSAVWEKTGMDASQAAKSFKIREVFRR